MDLQGRDAQPFWRGEERSLESSIPFVENYPKNFEEVSLWRVNFLSRGGSAAKISGENFREAKMKMRAEFFRGKIFFVSPKFNKI